jgi:hypothetical protein
MQLNLNKSDLKSSIEGDKIRFILKESSKSKKTI